MSKEDEWAAAELAELYIALKEKGYPVDPIVDQPKDNLALIPGTENAESSSVT